MSDPSSTHPVAAQSATTSLKEQRRVVAATVVGTMVEWYDFFVYSAAAALVFNTQFFTSFGPGAANVVSFATVGISFLFRPLGAVVAGHLGDRLGRRTVLVATLVMMGVATALIGVLPTSSQIGVAAPIALILLRIVQGISAGGEWGGAALMAVEHAPPHKRGLYGAGPQVGVPLGLLLSSGVMALMTTVAPGQAFLDWGWRVPFLLSVVLIAVGYWVRHSVEESPVYLEIAHRAQVTKAPLLQVFKAHTLLMVVAALVFVGNNAVGYMTTGGYIQRYATDPTGPIRLDRGLVLWIVAASAAIWLAFTIVGGWLSDRIGRRGAFVTGYLVLAAGVVALFPIVRIGTPTALLTGLGLLSVGLGLTYGPLAALFTELFPASLRFSGVSISYALGAILGGAFAPTVAELLMQRFHSEWAIVAYLGLTVTLGLGAALALKDRSGIPLGPDHEAEQSASPIRGLTRA